MKLTLTNPPLPLAGPAEPAPAPPVPEAPESNPADPMAAEPAPAPQPKKNKKTEEEKKAEKRRKKEERAFRDAHRPLDAWERYRALTDAVKIAQDLVDLADHKVRFGLIIMGAVNASFYILGTRTNLLGTLPVWLQSPAIAFLVGYALMALYFFLQAIDTLRPRKARHKPANAIDPSEMVDESLGVRFFVDVLQRDLEGYRRAWRQVRVDHLNAELTAQAYALAQINNQKYAALRRLYFGLKVMTVCAGIMFGTLGYYSFREKPQERAAMGRSRHKGRRGFSARAVLGQPTRFADTGVGEPSGVTYHAKLGHLFAVGGEGRLAELDLNGKIVRSDKVKGSLSDVAVHTPSGNLVIVAEKTSELVLWDPVAHKELKRWELDRTAILGEEPTADRKHAFMGLGFREDPSMPGGGIFYLVHEREPEVLVAIAFDPNTPSGRLEPKVVSLWKLEEHNLKAAWWVPSLNRLLVLSAKKGLVVLRPDGTVESEIILPGEQDEGFCLDADGDLWVADARGKSLLKFNGALQVLTAQLRADEEAAGEAPAGEGQPSPTPPSDKQSRARPDLPTGAPHADARRARIPSRDHLARLDAEGDGGHALVRAVERPSVEERTDVVSRDLVAVDRRSSGADHEGLMKRGSSAARRSLGLGKPRPGEQA